jgi:predicted HTH domain antitoxin
MRILVEVPTHFPDAVQQSPQQFAQEAKMAMAAKLFEMKRLSSGMATALAGVGRAQFLLDLHRYGVAAIDLTEAELASDLSHA